MKIIGVGDIATAGETYEGILLSGGNPLISLRSIIKDEDIAIASLETPLTCKETIFKNKCCLRSSPMMARAIKEAGISVVSLANNHLMDCGIKGLEDTIDALRKSGVRYVGAGRDFEEAISPVLVEDDLGKVAVLAANDVPVMSSPFFATKNSAGVAPYMSARVQELIVELKANGYRVVLCLHWGLEGYHYPSYRQIRMGHDLIDCGADLVLGNHVHVIQPVEKYKRGWIVYGQGNVLFPNPYRWSMQTEEGDTLERVDYLTEEKKVSVVIRMELLPDVREPELFKSSLKEDQGMELASGNREVPGWPWVARKAWRLLWPFYAGIMEYRLRIRPQISALRKGKEIRNKFRVSNIRESGALIQRCVGVMFGRRNSPYD